MLTLLDLVWTLISLLLFILFIPELRLDGCVYGNLFSFSNLLPPILKDAWSVLSAVTSSKLNRGDQYMQRKKRKGEHMSLQTSIQIGGASHP